MMVRNWAELSLKMVNIQGYWKWVCNTHTHQQADFTALSRAQRKINHGHPPLIFEMVQPWGLAEGLRVFEVQIDWWRVNLFSVSFRWIFFFFLCGFLAPAEIWKATGFFLFVFDQSSKQNLPWECTFSAYILILLCLKVVNLIGAFWNISQ